MCFNSSKRRTMQNIEFDYENKDISLIKILSVNSNMKINGKTLNKIISLEVKLKNNKIKYNCQNTMILSQCMIFIQKIFILSEKKYSL